MKYLVFDEIIRDLLVYLKGQVPLLKNRENSADTVSQIAEITTALRSSVDKLEEASYDNISVEKEVKALNDKITSLTEQNTKIKNDLTEKSEHLKEALKDVSAKSDELAEEKQLNKKLLKDLDNLKTDLDKAKEADSSKDIEILESQLSDVKDTLANSEAKCKKFKEEASAKELELTHVKKLLEESENLENRPEFTALKSQLAEFEKTRAENRDLKVKVSILEQELASNKVTQESLAEANEVRTHNIKLEEELSNTQKIVLMLREKVSQLSETENEKIKLKQQISDLEDTLKTVMKSHEETLNKYKDKFALTSEDCVNVFEALTMAESRLEHSVENKDLYKKVCDTLILFKKTNAIQQILSIGQIFDTDLHRVVKTYKSDLLPDGIIVKEENPGFICGDRLIQKAKVCISKSKFVCSDCSNLCRPQEFFCPKCGLELTSPDGASKRLLTPLPNDIKIAIPLIDKLVKQGNLKGAKTYLEAVAKEHPANPDIEKRQTLLAMTEKASQS
ncbi:MAG: nucleotide exchange factor GrpE [Candidatus Riflebacteria bacterium]|nr:nucleotide exchange factor GrpE [bacterium]